MSLLSARTNFGSTNGQASHNLRRRERPWSEEVDMMVRIRLEYARLALQREMLAMFVAYSSVGL